MSGTLGSIIARGIMGPGPKPSHRHRPYPQARQSSLALTRGSGARASDYLASSSVVRHGPGSRRGQRLRPFVSSLMVSVVVLVTPLVTASSASLGHYTSLRAPHVAVTRAPYSGVEANLTGAQGGGSYTFACAWFNQSAHGGFAWNAGIGNGTFAAAANGCSGSSQGNYAWGTQGYVLHIPINSSSGGRVAFLMHLSAHATWNMTLGTTCNRTSGTVTSWTCYQDRWTTFGVYAQLVNMNRGVMATSRTGVAVNNWSKVVTTCTAPNNCTNVSVTGLKSGSLTTSTNQTFWANGTLSPLGSYELWIYVGAQVGVDMYGIWSDLLGGSTHNTLSWSCDLIAIHQR